MALWTCWLSGRFFLGTCWLWDLIFHNMYRCCSCRLIFSCGWNGKVACLVFQIWTSLAYFAVWILVVTISCFVSSCFPALIFSCLFDSVLLSCWVSLKVRLLLVLVAFELCLLLKSCLFLPCWQLWFQIVGQSQFYLFVEFSLHFLDDCYLCLFFI